MLASCDIANIELNVFLAIDQVHIADKLHIQGSSVFGFNR